MENTGATSTITSIIGQNGTYIFIALLMVAGLLIGYVLYKRANTMPVIMGFENPLPPPIPTNLKKEGFYGGVAVGAGLPDCLRTSSEAAVLYSTFAGKVDSVEEGPRDFQEFTLLLSTLACFKKDLIGIANVVEATRYQPFDTQIDLEPIAETTARCFAKTIPPRDLELAFDKWSKRGQFLITRLCTAANLNESEVAMVEEKFKTLIVDVKDVATSRCLTGTPTIGAEPSPREEAPYTPPSLIDLGPYKGYY